MHMLGWVRHIGRLCGSEIGLLHTTVINTSVGPLQFELNRRAVQIIRIGACLHEKNYYRQNMGRT